MIRFEKDVIKFRGCQQQQKGHRSQKLETIINNIKMPMAAT